MDTTAANIAFDENGMCNFCSVTIARVQQAQAVDKPAALRELIENIRAAGKGRPYDVVIGVSGGVDSSYLAYLVKNEFGLRPLAVHLDNGWNSELAVKNIENILQKLDIELHTEVLDWEEFRSLQVAFLRSSTPDLEIPTDHAIAATLYHMARKERVPYVLTGMNVWAESIMPRDWSWGHWDWRYVASVNKLFGTRKLRSFPHLSLLDRTSRSLNWPVATVNVLDLVDYKKDEAQALLMEKFDWKPYEQKHFESTYTKFFQAVLLPRKFGIDKRRAHAASLICSGQLTRDQALAQLQQPTLAEEDVEPLTEYVAKKLGLSLDEMHAIMALPNKRFEDYPSQENAFYWSALMKTWKSIKKIILPRQTRRA
jgi:N-acetyl sugar amidotransferase